MKYSEEMLLAHASDTNHFLDRPVSGQYMPNPFPELGADQEWFTEGKVWHELTPREGDIVIHKPSYGAFYDTPLDTILRQLGKDIVIICGTLTNCCCGTTARQAYERSYYNILRFAFAKVLSAKQIMELK